MRQQPLSRRLAGPSGAPGAARRRLVVQGTVQGVGFRPFIYRIAVDEGLSGWVRNAGRGVEIEVEGEPARIRSFLARLRAEAPPLARIASLRSRSVPPTGRPGFLISASRPRRDAVQPVVPDVATCAECLAEVLDPAARRHGYPFTNCTRCGPRFTVIEDLPYDRERTTMRAFPLCAACGAEYEDPGDRRFHAEPIACPGCGPRLVFRKAGAAPAGPRDAWPRELDASAALEAAVAALRAGRIVAVKGLGGFQLACAAADDAAVRRLRHRKNREAKPLAVMVRDLDAARSLCHVSLAEAAALASPRAPIVLLRRRRSAAVSASVAPGLDMLGVMLPCTPLHHLLLRAWEGALVMTSGNRSGEPIAYRNDEALQRLGPVADAFLLHDRAIASAYDDSVVRVDDRGREVVLRRARGYAPEPVRLALRATAPILAVGGQLKSTFCLVRDDLAFVSQHIGDLDDADALDHLDRTLRLYRRLFRTEPAVVAHDLHPDYAATRYAASLPAECLVGVQHHHAHIVSCLAEHGWTRPAIGVALDGAGHGEDGGVWGGEVMVCDWSGYRRTASLRPLRLPGGDAAAREPWRMAVAALAFAFDEEEADRLVARLLPGIDRARARPVLAMALRGVNAPLTSGAGRLFDAVAALAGIRHVNRYEGQAAMELEAAAGNAEAEPYPLPLHGGQSPAVLDTLPLVRAVVRDVVRGTPPGEVGARFHSGLAGGIAAACAAARAESGLETVALSGGCFQNRRLSKEIRDRLAAAGFRVLEHARVPASDGGLSLGQAAVALARTAAGS